MTKRENDFILTEVLKDLIDSYIKGVLAVSGLSRLILILRDCG